MDLLPPTTERKLVRTRRFKLGPDGVSCLLRDLKHEKFTGEVVVNMSQGGLGQVVVKDCQAIGEPEGIDFSPLS